MFHHLQHVWGSTIVMCENNNSDKLKLSANGGKHAQNLQTHQLYICSESCDGNCYDGIDSL